MLTRAVTSPERLRSIVGSAGRRLGKYRYAAFLVGEFEGDLDPRQERVLDAIYWQISVGDRSKPGGCHKWTWRSRLRQVDDALLGLLETRFAAGDRLRVHDMAASNAVTSLDLFELLRDRPMASVHATDFFDRLFVVDAALPGWKVVLNADRSLLQFVGPGMVVRRSSLERTPFGKALGAGLKALLYAKAVEAVEAQTPGAMAEIELFHPHCVRAAAEDPRFTLGRDNLFDPAPGTYEVIRVMNASALGELGPEQSSRFVKGLFARLAEGGLFILGLNVGDGASGQIRATICERSGGFLKVVKELGGGIAPAESFEGRKFA
ncbi:MAG: hypothetical protein IT535_01125 [Bauldia sp.]|nr:hypothetical protein [Bauldia sp.]